MLKIQNRLREVQAQTPCCLFGVTQSLRIGFFSWFLNPMSNALQRRVPKIVVAICHHFGSGLIVWQPKLWWHRSRIQSQLPPNSGSLISLFGSFFSAVQQSAPVSALTSAVAPTTAVPPPPGSAMGKVSSRFIPWRLALLPVG
jgi:hypothetical protein